LQDKKKKESQKQKVPKNKVEQKKKSMPVNVCNAQVESFSACPFAY